MKQINSRYEYETEEEEKSRPLSDYFKGEYLKDLWRKHWGIIITAIAALIIGIIFILMISR